MHPKSPKSCSLTYATEKSKRLLSHLCNPKNQILALLVIEPKSPKACSLSYATQSPKVCSFRYATFLGCISTLCIRKLPVFCWNKITDVCWSVVFTWGFSWPYSPVLRIYCKKKQCWWYPLYWSIEHMYKVLMYWWSKKKSSKVHKQRDNA